MPRSLMIVFVLLTTFSSLHAQPDDLLIVEVDSNKHFIHYNVATSPTFWDAARAMIEVQIPLFETFTEWSFIPSIVIDFEPLSAVDADGTALSDLHAWQFESTTLPFDLPEGSPAKICYIGVYDVPGGDLGGLEAALAVELAQCFMFANIPAAEEIGFEFVLDHEWWGEGGAYWMAEKIVPTLDMTKVSEVFQERLGRTLLKAKRGSYYFWQYLESKSSTEDVLAFVRNMPANPDDHLVYLKDNLPIESALFMHDFAMAVHDNRLNHLPPVEDLFSSVTLGDLPSQHKIEAQPFAINLRRVNLADTDQGVVFEATELSDSGLMVSFADGTLIEEAELLEMCDTDGKFFFVYSRATGGELTDPPTPANLKFDEHDCDDDSDAEEGAVPACVVGTWRVTQLPYTAEMGEVSMGGLQQISVDRDGNTVTTYEEFTQSIPMENMAGSSEPLAVILNGTVTGQIAISADGTVSDVGETNFDISAVASIPGGMMMDITPMIQDMAGLSVGFPSSSVAECVDENTLHLNIRAGEFAGTVILER